MLKKIMVTILTVFLLTGAVYAQDTELPNPGILPGNPFYFLKTWSESIGTFFTFNDEAKADRMLYLSEKRLAEVNELSNIGQVELAEETIIRYEEHLTAALVRAQEARSKGKDVDDVFVKVAEATYKHQDVLTDVLEKVPEEAQESVRGAMQESMKGYEEALGQISSQERERVMENVQNRMQEVEQKVNNMRERGVEVPNVQEVTERVRNMQGVDVEEVQENLMESGQKGRP